MTASPNKGIDATLDWAIRLQADGFRAIPHLSARMIPTGPSWPSCSTARADGRADPRLRRRWRRRRARRVPRRAVAAPGDDRARPPVRGHRLPGLPQRPRRHPGRGPRAGAPRQGAVRRARDLADGLRHEAHRALGPAPARRRASRRTSSSACPGVADPQKLLNVAARIGVKDAKRFLVKNLRFVTGMARSGGFYKPTGFVEDLAPLLADPARRRDRLPPVHVQRRRGDRGLAPVDARGVTRRLGCVAGPGGLPGAAVDAAARGGRAAPCPTGEWAPEQVVRHLIAVEIEVHQARLADLDDAAGAGLGLGGAGAVARRAVAGPRRAAGPVRRRCARRRWRRSMALDEAGWARAGHAHAARPLDVAGLLPQRRRPRRRAPGRPRLAGRRQPPPVISRQRGRRVERDAERPSALHRRRRGSSGSGARVAGSSDAGRAPRKAIIPGTRWRTYEKSSAPMTGCGEIVDAVVADDPDGQVADPCRSRSGSFIVTG